MPKFSESNYNTLETYFNILGFTRSGDDNSYLVSQNGVIIAIGGVYTPLYQLKDNGDMVGYKFLINSIEGDHFNFNYLGKLSTHSISTEIEVGKEMYFRKDAFFRDWVYQNRSEYGNFLNTNKDYIYFGKIYQKSDEDGVYYVVFEGIKNWVTGALPQNNQTPRLVDFIDIAFDHVYHETYNKMKNLWSFFDPKEVNLEHLWYLADKFRIDIDTDFPELILREWVDQLNYFIKRKGTYTAYYIIYKLLFSNTKNKLNIYERWLEWCHKRVYGDKTPVEYFNDHHILEHYGVWPSGGAGDYWYEPYDPKTYPSAANSAPWQRLNQPCFDPQWICGDFADFGDFFGSDSGNNIKIQQGDLISIEDLTPSGDYVYLHKEVDTLGPTAGGFRHCISFYVPASGTETSASTTPSGSIAIWSIQNEADTRLDNSDNAYALTVDVRSGGLGASIYNSSTHSFSTIALPGTLDYDKDYYALIKSGNDPMIEGLIFDHGTRKLSSMVASGSLAYDGSKRKYVYAVNTPKHDNDENARINIDISNMNLSSEYTRSIGPTGNYFLTPHYKVEVDLSTEPMQENAIISEYYATELLKYWRYTKPVSKYVYYHFLLSPIAKIDNFSESYSLYDTSLAAYCDTRFTGSAFLSAASSGSGLVGEDFGEKTYVFRQSTSKDEWRIQHNLGQENLIVQVYDENDQVVYMDNVIVESSNIMVLQFEAAIRGSAFIAGLKDWNTDHTQTTSAGTWVITHNMGTSGASGFGFDIYNLARDEYLIPDTVEETNKNVMTVYWSTSGAPASADGHIPIRDEDYIHYQTTPATTWTINHGLGAAGFIVEVWSGNEYVYPESITLTNSNTVTITFAEPTEGFATLVFFAREFSTNDVYSSLLNGGYWKTGDTNNELFDPVVNNNLYSPTTSGSITDGVFLDRGDMFTFDFSIPTGEDLTIKEIGLFNNEDNIMFYTRCSELYKPADVQLDVHYRLLKE